MKVTLVFAGITVSGFSGSLAHEEGSWIHHGLGSIGAYAKFKGFDVDLIDLRRLKNWEDFKKSIAHGRPEVVGLTMMSVDYNAVMKCVGLIKEVGSEIKVVVGGIHPTLMPDEVDSNPKIDYIIQGEGEISFVNLLFDIQNGKLPSRIIQGIPPDLDQLPFVDRTLFPAPEASIFDGLANPFVTIIAGRGCRYNCSFCQPAERILFGREVRRRSVDNVIKELSLLNDKFRFKSLLLHDDCLTEDIDWVEEFCNKYRTGGFRQPFVCQSRPDIICHHQNLISKMKEAGLHTLMIGFESGNQRILDFLRKGITVQQNYQAAQICRRYGVKIWANYMVGIPTETREEVMDTVRMIREIRPEHPSHAYYTPAPGSDLFQYCLDSGLSLINNHDSYRRNPDEPKIKGHDYQFLYKALIMAEKELSPSDFWLKPSRIKNVMAMKIKSRSPRLFRILSRIKRYIRKISDAGY